MQQQAAISTTRGTVVWFDDAKGFGFIRPDGDPATVRDVFVHYSAIESSEKRRRLLPDQVVEFEIVVEQKGPIAHHVRVVQP